MIQTKICPRCGGEMVNIVTDLKMNNSCIKLIMLKVKADKCIQCNEKVYKQEDIEMLQDELDFCYKISHKRSK